VRLSAVLLSVGGLRMIYDGWEFGDELAMGCISFLFLKLSVCLFENQIYVFICNME